MANETSSQVEIQVARSGPYLYKNIAQGGSNLLRETFTITVLGGIGAVALAPVVLGAVGFTSAGIAAGSYAASMMSAAAVANGGGVAAGSLVAILQSAGAGMMSSAAIANGGGVAAGSLVAILQSGGKKK
uniref:Uncharacterized protein n=1 Tax=Poecilia mexicana TaxID=48701 RepID=A0A3B3YAA7_9TELE